MQLLCDLCLLYANFFLLFQRNYDQEEVGRIVFYTTSMGIVRTTFERCRKVRKILETLMVKFEERDVFMNKGFQQEVRERLGLTRVIVPQVFVEGRHLGVSKFAYLVFLKIRIISGCLCFLNVL